MMVEFSDCGGEIHQTAEEKPPAGTTVAAKESLPMNESSSLLVALCL